MAYLVPARTMPMSARVASLLLGAKIPNTSPAANDTEVPPLEVNVPLVPEALNEMVPTELPFFWMSNEHEPVAAVPALA
jgi:hypothetical protein